MQLAKEKNVWTVGWWVIRGHNEIGQALTCSESLEFDTAHEAFASLRDGCNMEAEGWDEEEPYRTAIISVAFGEYTAFARGNELQVDPYTEGGPPKEMGVPKKLQDEYTEAWALRKEWD
jgi:hypothetical protein